jgi:hypothetical protein
MAAYNSSSGDGLSISTQGVSMKMGMNPNALRPIVSPHLSISATETCYGEECGRSFSDTAGNLVLLPGHIHIQLSDPGGGSRTFGVAVNDDDDWRLPADVFESSH